MQVVIISTACRRVFVERSPAARDPIKVPMIPAGINFARAIQAQFRA